MTKAAGPSIRHRARSLRTRLIAFLTIALLPLGAIAVLQTLQVIEETERLADRDALSRTARAAEEQAALLQRAFGAASALGSTAIELADDTETCSAIMADFLDDQRSFVFAGFIAADGVMTCNNRGDTVDYTGTPNWEQFVANPSPHVYVNRRGEVSGQSVYIVFRPFFEPETGALLGGQAVSIPHALSETLFADEEDGLDLALIGADGTILASSTGMDDLTDFHRRGVVPDMLDVPERGLLVKEEGLNPFDRPTALVPLIPGEIYVLGLWTPGGMETGVSTFNRTVPIFPVLMWLASLAVAYLTVNNLILRPLSRLSGQMRRYRADRPGAAFVDLPDAPSEVQEIAESYNTLLDRVAADTARLQETVAEKDTLLREVHHRVKNNLQLISSIINMQMRTLKDQHARRILSRVQDRVMSLSSVHRALYTDNQLTAVRADELLHEIVEGIADLAASATRPIALSADLRPVRLDPDQAVPLSLLATEAMTNAVKYAGATGDAEPTIEVSLHEDDTGLVTFRVRNTCGAEDDPGCNTEADGTGLGARLIRSFASQLNGEIDIEVTEASYDLVVRFQSLPPG